jgi:histidinol-phosphate aminotransferase
MKGRRAFLSIDFDRQEPEMMKPSSLNRRNFIRMGTALPIASAVLPSLATSAFAEAAGAVGAIPAVGYIDVPANVALLNINEYPSGPTPAAVEIMHKMAANGNRYYMSETSKFATELAAYHELKPNYLTIYAGSSEVLHFTTLAFTSPTRSLVTADPTFEQTWRVAAANGAKVHKVPLKADYSHDMKAMVAADPNAGMYYLCNPNNPTGVPIKRADIEWLLANKAPGSVVLVDEAYIQFSDAESVIDLVSKDKDLIVSRTFSKIYSMGGLRFGYAMARPDLMEKLHFYGVNSMATTAVQCAKVQLADKQLIPLRKQAMADAREKTFEWLTKHGYTFTPSQANHFMLDMKRPGGPVTNALAHRSVMIGRTWPVWPNYARVTVGSAADMQSFQTAFLEVMQMPTDKVNAMVHPYPHLLNAHVC